MKNFFSNLAYESDDLRNLGNLKNSGKPSGAEVINLHNFIKQSQILGFVQAYTLMLSTLNNSHNCKN